MSARWPYDAIKYGWLDRRGIFRETGEFGHTDYAESLGKDEEDLEQLGWVKITWSMSVSKNIAIWEVDRLTKAQVSYLNSIGFDVDENSIGYQIREDF